VISKVCSVTGTVLTDELVEPLFDNFAVAIRIYVTPLRRSRRVAIELDVEAYGRSEMLAP
jgi:hypothetical protein